nr:zinc finger, CCHC-type [Tanacetum cinerariifolium]
MTSMNTRLNIKKLNGNIVQKHKGSEQVGLKQLDSKQVSNNLVLNKLGSNNLILEDKQPEEKTNTDCLLKEQEKEYQTGWKIMTGNVLDSCNEKSIQQCMKSGVAKHLVVAGIQHQNGLVDETNVTLFANGIIFEVEPRENIDQGAGLQEVQTQDLINYQLARDRKQHLASELFGYREDSNEAAFAVATMEKIYAYESLTFNNTVACEAKIWATKGLLDKTKENVIGMKIVKDQSGYTLRVSQSRFYNGKLVQTLLEGHSILSLEGSLSEDCDV